MSRSKGIDWGRVPPEERDRWGRWLRVMRYEHGDQTQDEVLETLAKLGRPIGSSYYSEMETSAKKVNDDWRGVFTRLWGHTAEEWDDPWDQPKEPPHFDMARGEAATALVGAIQAQTKAIEQQTRLLERLTALLEGTGESRLLGQFGDALFEELRRRQGSGAAAGLSPQGDPGGAASPAESPR